MPELFYQRLKRMRLCAHLQLGGIILTMIGLVVPIECLFSGVPIIRLLPLWLLAAMGICGIVLSIKLTKSETLKLEPYFVSIPHSSMQNITDALGARKVEENAYIAFGKQDRLIIRILAQYRPEFDRRVISAQKKRANKVFNRAHGVKSWGSAHNIGRKLRINLVVCDSASPELLSWVCDHTLTLLNRAEIIVSAAIILDEGKLIFPACMSNLDFSQLDRYEAAAFYLLGRLCP